MGLLEYFIMVSLVLCHDTIKKLLQWFNWLQKRMKYFFIDSFFTSSFSIPVYYLLIMKYTPLLLFLLTLVYGETEKPIETEEEILKALTLSDPEKTNLEKLIAQTSPSIVHLDVESREGDGSGSGFFIGASGQVVTNYHVVDGATKITATLKSGLKLLCNGVLNLDEDHDLAVLKFAGKNFPSLSLAETSSLSVGQPLAVIGSPAGLEQSVSNGILSASREISGWKLLQITAPISQGSSGSPVLDMKGNVLGVATFYKSNGQNLNFASSSEHLEIIVKSLDILEVVSLADAFPNSSPEMAIAKNDEVYDYEGVDEVNEPDVSDLQTPYMDLKKGASTYMPVFNRDGEVAGYLWNNNYRDNDIAHWKGEYDDEGYASGYGHLAWGKTEDYSVKWIYSGTMMRGKFEGEVICHDRKTNSRGIGLYIKGRKKGTWHYSSSSGKKWTKEY